MPLNKIYKTANIEVNEGFKCDMCSKYYDFEHHRDDAPNTSTIPHFFHARHTFGYGSAMDGSTVEMTICEKCLLQFCQDNEIQINSEADRINHYKTKEGETWDSFFATGPIEDFPDNSRDKD